MVWGVAIGWWLGVFGGNYWADIQLVRVFFITGIMYIPQGFNHANGIPLIMEVGSLNTKIGFAGKDRPDVVAPSVPCNPLSMSK